MIFLSGCGGSSSSIGGQVVTDLTCSTKSVFDLSTIGRIDHYVFTNNECNDVDEADIYDGEVIRLITSIYSSEFGNDDKQELEIFYHKGVIKFTYTTQSCATVSEVKRCVEYDYKHIIGDNFIEVRYGYYGEGVYYIYEGDSRYNEIIDKILPSVVLGEFNEAKA
mgnify:CR=1 FL=1